MMEKGKREQRQKNEDAVFNRMLLWLAGAIVAELVIVLLKRMYVDLWLGVDVAVVLLGFFRVFRVAGLVLTVAAAAWLVVSARGGKPMLKPGIAIIVLASLWIIAVLALALFAAGFRILMVFPAIAGVLILIWFLYQRTFFVTSVLTGGGLAALWLYRQYYVNHPTVITACFIGGFVLLIAAALLAKKLGGSGGKLGNVQILSENAVYSIIYLTCVVTAAVMLLTMLLGAAAAFYLLFVLLAWLFVQAVYFTVKLM